MTFVEDEDRRLIKEVVKRQKFQLQERVVPAASVRSWAARIERLTPDIERLVQVAAVLQPVACTVSETVGGVRMWTVRGHAAVVTV